MSHSESHFSDMSLPLFGSAPPRARTKQPAYVADHRQRLRERFEKGGAEALPDYELLELVLFRALPRQDVKPLAHALLKRFGDFNAVLSAPIHRLLEQKGVGPSVVRELKIVEAAAQRLAKKRVMRRNVISSWDALLDYCHTTMAHREIEHFRALFLDQQNTLIADEELARGTVNHVPVYPREVAKRALELGASAVILVHNHPSGNPTPSQGDVEMTRKVQRALEALEIILHDHLVVGRSGVVSFQEAGYMS